MTELLYFNPKKNISSTDHIIFKLLPRNKKEAWKADEAERMLDPMQLLYYYGYVLVYGIFDFLPPRHQESIKNLIDAGIMDDILAHYAPDLTDSYVTQDKFYYKQKEVQTPENYIPRIRYIDEHNNILVNCVGPNGEIKVFRFIPEDRWEVWHEVDAEK